MSRFLSLSRYFFVTYVRARSFLVLVLLVVFTVIFLGYMSYQSLNVTGYDSIGYVLQRINGIEKQYLVYYFWSVPYQVYVILIPVIIASGIFTSDYESGESAIYYSYPVSWTGIVLSKAAVSFLVSMIPLVAYTLAESIFLGIYFSSLPPVAMLISFGATLPAVFAVASVTAMISTATRSPLTGSFFTLVLFFVLMNIINLFSFITGGNEPAGLLNNDVNVVTAVYSQINLVPFGSSGSIAPAGAFKILIDISYMAIYSSFSLAVTLFLAGWRDAA